MALESESKKFKQSINQSIQDKTALGDHFPFVYPSHIPPVKKFLPQ